MSNHTNEPHDELDGELGDELGRELHHRVDGIDDEPFGLGDVKARAGSIRRTRRLAAAGAACAVAVIVPVALFAGNGLDRAEGPGPSTTSPSATQSPSQAPTRATDPNTPSGTASASGQVHELSGDLPDGPPPALPWLDGTTLMRHDQDPLALPLAYEQVAVVGERIVAVRGDDEGNRTLSVLDASGALTGSMVQVVDGFVLDEAGAIAAWTTPRGDIQTLRTDGFFDLHVDLGGPVSPAAVVGDGSCREDSGGCRVFVNGPQFGDPPRVVDSMANVGVVAPGAIRVEDVSTTGLVALMRSSSDTGSCSGVLDEAEATYLWRTCEYSFLDFSPEGTSLLATDAYRDGFGLTYVTVLDTATGDPRVRFEIDAGAILQTVWEDEQHLLAVTYGEADGWRILRLGLDGGREVVATPAEPANQDERPLFVAGNP